MSDEPMRKLKRPYMTLQFVDEVPEARYHGMKVGLPPICFCCRRGTDGPASGSAECLCAECYELIRTHGRAYQLYDQPPFKQ